MRLTSNIRRENFSKDSNEIINVYSETRQQSRTKEMCLGWYINCNIDVQI